MGSGSKPKPGAGLRAILLIYEGILTPTHYDPVAPCKAYVKRLKAKGKDVQLTEYPGAGHVFDWQALKKPLKLEKAQTRKRQDNASSRKHKMA